MEIGGSQFKKFAERYEHDAPLARPQALLEAHPALGAAAQVEGGGGLVEKQAAACGGIEKTTKVTLNIQSSRSYAAA